MPIDPASNPIANDQTWRIKVPIIANFATNAQPCDGLRVQPGEAPIATDGEYRIIGFTTVDIFDYDIGENTVSTAATFQQIQDGDYSFSNSIETDNTTAQLTTYDYVLQHYFSKPVMGSVMKNAGDDIKIPAIVDGQYTSPLGFTVDGTPTACNLVRARAACDTNFIPSSTNEGFRSATLVYAPLDG